MAYSHQLSASQDQSLLLSLDTAASRTSHAVQALNLPAFLVELVTDVLTGSWPEGWSPSSIDLPTWRALAFPLYCLPFWWFVGFGAAALIKGDRLRRSLLFAGSVLWVLLVSLLVVFRFTAAQHAAILYPYFGFALWIALLSVFPGTWIKERLAHRRLKTRIAQRLLSGA